MLIILLIGNDDHLVAMNIDGDVSFLIVKEVKTWNT